MQAIFGLFAFHLIVWLLSEARNKAPWRLVGSALLLQFALAAVLLHGQIGASIFIIASKLMVALQDASTAGTSFVFGYLGGGPTPFQITNPQANFILALQALPLIIVISALSRVLLYWNVLQTVVRLLSGALERVLGIGGALSFSALANLFMGMTESPLLVRPYLQEIDRGEMLALMSTGLATIAGTVFVLYATILEPAVPEVAGHLLTASVISLPAAIAYSCLWVPPGRRTGATVVERNEDESTLDALAKGANQGVALLINIVAMLLVMVATVYLINLCLGSIEIAGQALSLQRLLGWVLSPICWLIGIPWVDSVTSGSLMGTKIVLNELIAYSDLAALPTDTMSERSGVIMLYALCGFANFGSMAMLIAGLTLLVPARRADIIDLAPRALIIGNLATLATGAVAGLVMLL
ncbi:MAG: nucleoside transporter C-terminal domain-containing protein [Pseudomonadota bacterium]